MNAVVKIKRSFGYSYATPYGGPEFTAELHIDTLPPLKLGTFPSDELAKAAARSMVNEIIDALQDFEIEVEPPPPVDTVVTFESGPRA